ncbi:MAG: hypothetical protein KKA64_02545 [Nanoarchaeota archaeon]|nr:hypothetical protein [Nanoarchaeota archaeon]
MKSEKQRRRIKAIIFDAGGVLFKTDWDSIKKEILKKHKFSIFLYSDYPLNIQEQFQGINVGKCSFRKVIKELSHSSNSDKIIQDYKKAYLKHQNINHKLLVLVKN